MFYKKQIAFYAKNLKYKLINFSKFSLNELFSVRMLNVYL